jgi:hypothetical protein
VDDLTYWFAPGDPLAPRQRRATHLLPNYDEYLIAYQDRGLAVPRLDPTMLQAGAGTNFPHQAIVDGQLAGSWRRTVRGGTTTVQIAGRRPLVSADTRALSLASEQYSKFLGTPVDLIYVK